MMRLETAEQPYAVATTNQEPTLDLSTWTRLREVEAYAKLHSLSLPEAIRDLVNTGLSYIPPLEF